MTALLRKSLLFGLVALFLVIPASSLGSVIAPPDYDSYKPPEGKYFKDVLDAHPFSSTINNLKEKGMVKGYPDGTFAPDSSISRAEFITLVMASVTKNPQGKNCFKDVKNEWYARFICSAKTKKLIKGYANGTFKPNNNINFAEASAIIAQAHRLKAGIAAEGEVWYKPFVAKLEAKSAIPVSIDSPEQKLSRGETAEILWRLKTKTSTKPTKTFESLSAPFPTLTSCAELKEKVTMYQYQQNARSYNYGVLDLSSSKSGLSMMAVPEASFAEESGAEDAAAPASSASDYSSTNVQVEGVDEADIIKNDGEFIYMVSGNSVRIVKAFPPEEMSQVAKLTFDDEKFIPDDMYVAGNRLVVVGYTYVNYSAAHPYYYGGNQRVKVYVVDMSDKQNLKQERSIEFEGSQISSRKVGNRFYLVLNDHPDYYTIMEQKVEDFEKVLPHFRDSALGNANMPVVPCSDVHFLPRYEQPNFLVVASFDISDPQSEVDREAILGSGETVYASPESLYVAATRYEYPEVEKFNVWQPPASHQSTTVFRFSLENGDVTYKTQGQVKGHILNQFAMDESGSAFRIATTTGEVWDTQAPAKNHLFILDRENLGTVLGKLENLAPGEKIYSVRFLGKRAYMVTFKKVDPFFVIDVEDPANPKVLGALKIPGFSDYLHPFDENHIIGFGKEAVDPQNVGSEWPGRDFDFAWYQGMKIALFDVTDVANPKMLFKELIGDRGTDSEVLRNHKALLYDKARNLFAFPVEVHEIKPELKVESNGYTGSTYGDPVFQGAYIYTLDLEHGFQLRGKVTHYDNGLPKKCYPNYGTPGEYCYFEAQPASTINRIVSIGDYLYTISLGKLKALKREDVTEVQKLVIPTDEAGLPGFLDDLIP